MKTNLLFRNIILGLTSLLFCSFGFIRLPAAEPIGSVKTKQIDEKEFETKFTPFKQLIRDRKYDTVISECNKIIKTYAQAQPRTQDYLYYVSAKGMIGLVHYEKGEYELAAPISEEVANLCSRETTLYLDDIPISYHYQSVFRFNAGECYEKLGNYSKAKDLYENLLVICEAEQAKINEMSSLPSYHSHVNRVIQELKTRIERCNSEIKNKTDKQG